MVLGVQTTRSAEIENPVENDLVLVNGDLVFFDSEKAEDKIAHTLQRIYSRLTFFRGEGLLDLREGFPYFQDVFARGSDLESIKAYYQRAILETPGVASLSSMDLSLDKPNRKLDVSFVAVHDSGVTFDGVLTPFVLQEAA